MALEGKQIALRDEHTHAAAQLRDGARPSVKNSMAGEPREGEVAHGDLSVLQGHRAFERCRRRSQQHASEHSRWREARACALVPRKQDAGGRALGSDGRQNRRQQRERAERQRR